MFKRMHFAIALALAFGVVACGDEDGDGTPTPTPADEAWVGVWLSEGANVAPLVFADPVNVDIVEATMNADGTVSMRQHNHSTEAWSTNPGTYSVTKSAAGTIHEIMLSYTNPAYVQEGIIEVSEGMPTTMKLEVVVRALYPVVPTVAGGFGADQAVLGANTQAYVKQ